jgi:hypothetical protein
MENVLQNLKNNIDFFLRNHIKLSRKNYFEENENKEGLFATQKALEREKFLFEKYNLDYLKNNSTKQNYLENLYIMDLLDKYFKVSLHNNLSVLDIGCKNWFYAKGEYFFFKKYCDNLILDGIELDANRLYTNLYSRSETAKFYVKSLQGANFLEGDFLKHEKKYDYLMWILPFVFQYPHAKWGLPNKYFQPEKMIVHAYNLLNEGGKIFVVNQGECEYEEQKKLCNKLKIKYSCVGEFQSDFVKYEINRYLIIIEK